MNFEYYVSKRLAVFLGYPPLHTPVMNPSRFADDSALGSEMVEWRILGLSGALKACFEVQESLNLDFSRFPLDLAELEVIHALSAEDYGHCS